MTSTTRRAQHFEAVQGVLRRCRRSITRSIRASCAGLDYYNRTVFEWTTQTARRAGHRVRGRALRWAVRAARRQADAGMRIAMGVERLIALMKEGPVFRAAVPDVYVVRQGDAAQHYAQNVAERMRDEGLDVVLHSGGGSFKSQMKKADASGARYAAIIGDDEAVAQKLTLKSLRAASEQTTVALDAHSSACAREIEKGYSGGSSWHTTWKNRNRSMQSRHGGTSTASL